MMEYRFEVIQYIKKFMKVGDDWNNVEVETEYGVDNWDDLQNLLMTLIDFGKGDITFKVRKIEVE